MSKYQIFHIAAWCRQQAVTVAARLRDSVHGTLTRKRGAIIAVANSAASGA